MDLLTVNSPCDCDRLYLLEKLTTVQLEDDSKGIISLVENYHMPI